MPAFRRKKSLEQRCYDSWRGPENRAEIKAEKQVTGASVVQEAPVVLIGQNPISKLGSCTRLYEHLNQIGVGFLKAFETSDRPV